MTRREENISRNRAYQQRDATISTNPRPPKSLYVAPIPTLALTRVEAAASIGMSLDSFERHVQPTLKMCRLGRMRLVPITVLQEWLTNNAERTP